MMTYLSLVTVFLVLKSILSNISIDIPALLLSLAYLFSSLHFQPMYAHKSEMSLLYTAYGWALLFYPFTHSMSLNHEFDSFIESNH